MNYFIVKVNISVIRCLLINKNKFLHNIELYNCKYVIYIILPFEKTIVILSTD